MREATSEQEIFLDKTGTFFGFGLGCGHCYEHEEGTAELEAILGVRGPGKGVLGVEARQQTALPATDCMVVHSGKTSYGCQNSKKRQSLPWMRLVVVASPWKLEEAPKARLPRHFQSESEFLDQFDHVLSFREIGLQARWGIDGFAVDAVGKAAGALLNQIREALLAKDLCVGLSGSRNPFARPGLNLLIASRIPQPMRDAVLAADKDYARLIEAFQSTGIQEILKQAGRAYHALSPAWADEGQTKLRFFLNPTGNRANYGWFSLEDLKEWAAGRGPVVKAA